MTKENKTTTTTTTKEEKTASEKPARLTQEQVKIFTDLVIKTCSLLNVKYTPCVYEFSTRSSKLCFSEQDAIINGNGDKKYIAVIPYKSFHSLMSLKLDIVSICLLGAEDFQALKTKRYFDTSFKKLAEKYGFMVGGYDNHNGYRITNYSINSEAEKILTQIRIDNFVYTYTDNKRESKKAEKDICYCFNDKQKYYTTHRLPAELDFILQSIGCKIFDGSALQPQVGCIPDKKGGYKYFRPELVK